MKIVNIVVSGIIIVFPHKECFADTFLVLY